MSNEGANGTMFAMFQQWMASQRGSGQTKGQRSKGVGKGTHLVWCCYSCGCPDNFATRQVCRICATDWTYKNPLSAARQVLGPSKGKGKGKKGAQADGGAKGFGKSGGSDLPGKGKGASAPADAKSKDLNDKAAATGSAPKAETDKPKEAWNIAMGKRAKRALKAQAVSANKATGSGAAAAPPDAKDGKQDEEQSAPGVKKATEEGLAKLRKELGSHPAVDAYRQRLEAGTQPAERKRTQAGLIALETHCGKDSQDYILYSKELDEEQEKLRASQPPEEQLLRKITYISQLEERAIKAKKRLEEAQTKLEDAQQELAAAEARDADVADKQQKAQEERLQLLETLHASNAPDGTHMQVDAQSKGQSVEQLLVLLVAALGASPDPKIAGVLQTLASMQATATAVPSDPPGGPSGSQEAGGTAGSQDNGASRTPPGAAGNLALGDGTRDEHPESVAAKKARWAGGQPA